MANRKSSLQDTYNDYKQRLAFNKAQLRPARLPPQTFLQWANKFIIACFTIFIFLVFLMYLTRNDPAMLFYLQVVLSYPLFIMLATVFHEWLHKYKAEQLGYKTEFVWDGKVAAISVTHDTEDQNWNKNARAILIYPYMIIIPIATIMVLVGVYARLYVFLVTGVSTLVAHGLFYQKDKRSSKQNVENKD